MYKLRQAHFDRASKHENQGNLVFFEKNLYQTTNTVSISNPTSLKQPSLTIVSLPHIYLHLIFAILQFEISNLMNWIFLVVWTGIIWLLLPVKFKFKLGNAVHQIGYFKLENCKNQVQIDRGIDWLKLVHDQFFISRIWKWLILGIAKFNRVKQGWLQTAFEN